MGVHDNITPGYSATTTADDVIAGVDLSGRVAVVTGASAGIGVETVRALASAGATVVMGVRSEERGAAAAEQIRTELPAADLEVESLDLASLTSVREFAGRVGARHPSLNLLVNNAGVIYTPEGRTADGFEMQFGTNHVGHFLLTNLLIPSLLAGAPSRVVNLSSGAHVSSDIIWDDPNFDRHPYDKFVAYGQSKSANIRFTVELDRRGREQGLRAFAVHPGRVGTDLARHMTSADIEELAARAKRSPSGSMPPLKSVEEGAATSVWAATSAELADAGGSYLEDCQVSSGHAPGVLDADGARRLWALTEELVGERFTW